MELLINILFWAVLVIVLSVIYAIIPSDKKCKKCGSEKKQYQLINKEENEVIMNGGNTTYKEIITYEKVVCAECGERRDKKCRKCGEYSHLKTVEIPSYIDASGNDTIPTKKSYRECSNCGRKIS